MRTVSYPYPFFDPINFDNGYGTVAVFVVVIDAVIAAGAVVVVWRRAAAWERRAGH